MNGSILTIAGNLGDTPELTLTPNGKATSRMRVAVTERRRDDAGEWVDGDTSWHTVIAWGGLAEQAAANLSKGARVIVHGRLAERSFQTKEGEDRTVWELTADEIGPALRHAPADSGAGGTWAEQPQSRSNAAVRQQARPAGNRYARAGKN